MNVMDKDPLSNPDEGIILLPDDGKKHLFDKPANVKRVIAIFFIACAGMFLLDTVFFFQHKHLSFKEGVFPIEGWYGFYGAYGFTACVLLVLIAKYIVRKLLKRNEDYYER